MTLNAMTGLISGIPTISGTYNVQVTVSSATANLTFQWPIVVSLPPPVVSTAPVDAPNFSLDVAANSMYSDVPRSRIYCRTENGLVVIDSSTKAILETIPVGRILGLGISKDSKTLWFIRAVGGSIGRLNLDTLSALPDLPTSEPVGEMCEGLDGRIYAANSSEILQMDAASGVVQARIQSSAGFRHAFGPSLAMSPDQKTLYATDSFYVGSSLVTHAAISSYDVQGNSPVLLQRVELPAVSLGYVTLSPLGDRIYVSLGTNDGYGSNAIHQTVCLSTRDLAVTVGTFSYRGTAGPFAIAPDGKHLLQPIVLTDSGLIESFDTATFQLTKTIVLGYNSYLVPVAFGGVAIAGSSLDVYVATGFQPQPLRVYSNILNPPANGLLNLATRLDSRAADGALIGGFILNGSLPKKVVVRALGPSLPVAGKMIDPRIELHDSTGQRIAQNDNWNQARAAVLATGLAPLDEHEAVIVVTLDSGSYTAVVRGVDDTGGVAVLEVYDASGAATSPLVNIATRGEVGSGDDVMIGGLIVGGADPVSVAIRALGPSLAGFAVPGWLANPMLELHDGNGMLVAENDDWREMQAQALSDADLAPLDDRESAMIVQLRAGSYTAIVRGKNNTTGIGLVEVYYLQ